MRRVWIVATLFAVSACAPPNQAGTTDVADPSPLVATPAPPPRQTSPLVAVDYSACSEARDLIGQWSRALLLIGATQMTVRDLLGPGLLEPDSSAGDAAADDMFDAAEFLVGWLNTLDPLIRESRDSATDCLTSSAYDSLSAACKQAVEATLEPERSRPGAWLGSSTRFVEAILDAVGASIQNNFVVPSRERTALREAEREAAGPIDDMMQEAAHINRLFTGCEIP